MNKSTKTEIPKKLTNKRVLTFPVEITGRCQRCGSGARYVDRDSDTLSEEDFLNKRCRFCGRPTGEKQ